jgi:amino acid transporter
VFVVLAVMCLSFLQVSAGSTVVLDWFINISTASQLVTWVAMSVTFIRFHKACKLQGVSMEEMPYRSRLQPYAAWYALSMSLIVLFINGYPVFLKGNWSTPDL